MMSATFTRLRPHPRLEQRSENFCTVRTADQNHTTAFTADGRGRRSREHVAVAATDLNDEEGVLARRSNAVTVIRTAGLCGRR